MKRVALTLLLLTGVLGAPLLVTFSDSHMVYAQCSETKNGKLITTTDGTIVCDCTATTGHNCRCTVSVPCRPGEEGFETEEGGSS
jgi:hypothetical protein